MSAVTFQSEDHFAEAFYPLSSEEVEKRMDERVPLKIHFDEKLSIEKKIPIRNFGVGNIVATEVYSGNYFGVYYPEKPRVPHHLAIAMKREVKGLGDLKREECQELFKTLKKVAEIYKTVGIRGFVIAQYDSPQEGHKGCYVVEVIPHLPGFEKIKNIVDKMDCNRHVLYRSANISPILFPFKVGEIEEGCSFWQKAFIRGTPPLQESEIEVTYPVERMESHHRESEEALYYHLLEMLQDKGAFVKEARSFSLTMPTKSPEEVKTVTIVRCFFCDPMIIKKQLVFEYENVLVFYNIRKGAKPGSNFLLLPKRHTQKVYGLTAEEIENIRIVRGVLAEVLKEMHPESEVVVYVQDDPSIGQTVFHTHEQVVAVDPKTVALTWTLMSLYPEGNVSDEEMERIKGEFSKRLWDKMYESDLKKVE